jgi:TetR/AcrR family transcriptional repressor of bet genes
VGRPSNSAERRAQIVDGMLAVMQRSGYEGATIQAIGKAAGLTPGLVHYHFSTKQEVLIAMVEALTTQLAERYAARKAAANSPTDRLYAFVDAHVALGKDADPRAVAAWNLVGSEALRNPEVRALYRAALARTLTEARSLVRACLAAEGRATRDATRIAAALVSAIEGAYRVAAVQPKQLPRGYAAPMLRKMARGLIEAEPRAPGRDSPSEKS